MPNYPTVKLEWAPAEPPTSETPFWEDITDLLYAWEWTYGRNDENGEFQAGNGYVLLDNRTRIFDPAYTGQDTTNLITNGGFETNTTGWFSVASGGVLGAAISRVSDYSRFGTSSLRVVGAQPNDSTARAIGAGFGGALSASTTYTFSAYLKTVDNAVGASSNYVIQIDWYSGFGSTYLSSSFGTEVDDDGADWLRMSVTGTSPPTANYANLIVYVRTVSPNDAVDFRVDGAQLEQSTTAKRYVETDGATRSRTSANVKPRRKFRMQANWNGTWYPVFVAHARGYPQTYPDGLDKQVRIELADALALLKAVDLDALGFNRPPELSSDRIDAILDEADIPDAERDLDVGDVFVDEIATDTGTGSALEAAQNTAGTEGWPLYVTRAGKVAVD